MVIKQQLGYLFLVLIFTSCVISSPENKLPQIVEIPGTSNIIDNIERFGGLLKDEYFIIFDNPKENSTGLLELINDFNQKTLSIDTLLKYRSFTRYFYKKTECTMEVYIEGKEWTVRGIVSDNEPNLSNSERSRVLYKLEKYWCGNRAELVSISWNVDSEQSVSVSYRIATRAWRQTWRYEHRFRNGWIFDASDDELFNLKEILQ
jgi:hypothetical protein